MKIQNSSIFRVLLLLKLLLGKKLSRKEIVQEFKNFSIDIKETSILNYIKKLKRQNINVVEEKINKAKYYHIENNDAILNLTKSNIKILNETKKMLFAQRDYKLIGEMMRLFYLVSEYIDDIEIKEEFLDFGYYSTLNWKLIKILEQHCKNKDILLLDYILPYGGNKLIQFHVDKIAISSMSQRLYLYGLLKDGYDFFELPIDRIFMVKKVIRENVKFNFRSTLLEYKVSKSAFLDVGLEDNEIIKEEDEKFVVVQTPVVNEFNTVQKLLHYCPDLYYISDEKIKKLVVEKLEILKSNYEKRTFDK